MTDRPGPPAACQWLLGRMLDPADRESVLGELSELYEIQCGRRGIGWARRWYARHTVVFAWQLLRHGRKRGSAVGRSAFRAALEGRNSGEGRWEMMRFSREVRLAVRRLGRARVFTTVAVATIGVGIGSFTAIFGLVESVLLEDMPYESPDQLVWIWRDYIDGDFPRGWLNGLDITEMRGQTEAFASVAALRSATFNLSAPDGGDARQVAAHLTSHELFGLLGVRPILGRDLRPEDEVEGVSVAILGYDLWAADFGADPDVVGTTVLLDDQPTRVIGVAPENFRFVKHGSLSEPLAADLYMPLTVDLSLDNGQGGGYAAIARVRDGVDDARLEAALAAAARPINQTLIGSGSSRIRLWDIGVREDLVSTIRPALWALVGSASFLLLMLAANLTTLLLGRAALREQEMGVRRALGAGSRHVVWDAAAESVVLAAAGGALGVGLAYLAMDAIVAVAPQNLPRLAAVELDPTVLGVALLVTAAMAALASLSPMLLVARSRIASVVREGGARAGSSRGTVRLRTLLVAGQVALSFMLLVGGGLVAQAFGRLLVQDPGFDAGTTMTFRVPLPRALYAGPEQLAFHDEVIARVAALPGVEHVGAASALPLTQITSQRGMSFPGAPGNRGTSEEDSPLVDWFRATPGYVDAAGLRLLEGRDFVAADADSTTFSLIIDDVLAERFFPGGSAIGANASLFGLDATIVGVVDQPRLYRVDRDDRGQVFIPFARFPTTGLSYAVRTSVPPESVMPGVRAIVRDLDAAVPLSNPRTLDTIVGDSLGQQRLSLVLILSFALGALLLATLGVYGVVANGVVRRTQEIGVRMALGATNDGVVRLVLGQALRVSVAGALLGLVGALVTTRLLEGVMVGVEPGDPLVYLVVSVALVGIAQIASYLPARRATRIDPIDALRS